MDIRIILILLLSALIHSTWNILTKKSIDKQVFLWIPLFIIAVVFFIPFIIFYRPIPEKGLLLILLSGVFQTLYYVLLGSSYKNGDISVVYPLARGSSPLFVTLIAMLVLHEPISLKGFAGIFAIIAGIYVIHLREISLQGLAAPVLSLRSRTSQLAILTGSATAGYSLVDKTGLQYAHPILYLYLILVIPAILLLPYMLLKKRAEIKTEWRCNKYGMLSVAAMSILSYLLVLLSMKAANVSYVSSVREISIVFTTLYGTIFLKERFADKKILGSLLIFSGIFLIMLSK